MSALVSSRERVAWAIAFAAVSALLVWSKFTSADPDSNVYATIAAGLHGRSVSQWIAPTWRVPAETGGGEVETLFHEHPAGVFWVPALLDRIGIPAMQATYIAGIGAGLMCLWLTSSLVASLAGRAEGRAALVCLQIMPLAFLFRIRGNHEYPMYACLLLCLVGLSKLRRAWPYAALVALGFAGAVVIKGVFALLVGVAAGLWIVFNPTRERGLRGRQILAVAGSLAGVWLVIVVYDAAYVRATGHAFWAAYWQRQIEPVTFASQSGEAPPLARQLGYYAIRLLWHPAPWSLALIWAGGRRWLGRPPVGGPLSAEAKRGLYFSLAFAAVVVLALSLPSRFAERYIFSVNYAIAACGVVAAVRSWPRVRDGLAAIDRRVPALAAALWTTLMLLRIGLGPWLPRLQNH